jgi:hypothetical protein
MKEANKNDDSSLKMQKQKKITKFSKVAKVDNFYLEVLPPGDGATEPFAKSQHV